MTYSFIHLIAAIPHWHAGVMLDFKKTLAMFDSAKVAFDKLVSTFKG